ncbi:DUF429 domain-containing protein [Thermaurantimonas aggregans]|uniref:DUF429 domain-containing protein n=1 Tax=Thermaurantimonas aggregans TaxID=2173829 RepID=UPI0023F132C6|nr:DUF429 domain-containing protein [Thermaurantimonas aggregans]MCX8147668.1 DUF429 domain-containing protein [Thermaurantimonas aggregans]
MTCLPPECVLFGVDFGSRYAGTTVIAVYEPFKIYFLSCKKEEDADAFIEQSAIHFSPDCIFLDAPLSLPGRYVGLEGFDDYFYRKADIQCGAMSPMFLGGLTARAIRLRDKLALMGIFVFETYPKLLASELDLLVLGYKKDKTHLQTCRAKIASLFNPAISLKESSIESWHHFDALLALMSAMKYRCKKATALGDPKEGLIYY